MLILILIILFLDAEDQPFGNLVPLSYYTDLCRDVYGTEFIPSRIDDTNTYYGGHSIPANGPTNILFVNGEIDPWHSLGITLDISPTLLHILISGKYRVHSIYISMMRCACVKSRIRSQDLIRIRNRVFCLL